MGLPNFAWIMPWWIFLETWKWVQEMSEEYGLGTTAGLLQEMNVMASIFFFF